MERTAIPAATLVAGVLVTAGASVQTFERYAREGDGEVEGKRGIVNVTDPDAAFASLRSRQEAQ